jgi:putative nucleotidyltransferase with HDIG domain
MFKAATGANQDMAERLWYHSIGAGVAARVVARRLGLTDPEQYFVAGLLHDIGKIVLFRCAPEDLQNTLYTAEQKGVSFIEAENEVCGTNHTLIGAMLGAKWGFPPNLVEAASLHHRPEQAKAQPVLTAVVHLADIISRALDIGSGGDPLVPAFNKSARALLDMDASRLTVIMRDVEREYPEVQTMLTAA